jgi:hypothetical protein
MEGMEVLKEFKGLSHAAGRAGTNDTKFYTCMLVHQRLESSSVTRCTGAFEARQNSHGATRVITRGGGLAAQM